MALVGAPPGTGVWPGLAPGLGEGPVEGLVEGLLEGLVKGEGADDVPEADGWTEPEAFGRWVPSATAGVAAGVRLGVGAPLRNPPRRASVPMTATTTTATMTSR